MKHKPLIAVIACSLLTGCATTSTQKPSVSPDVPVAVVGTHFVNDAVEILEDYKDYKSGNTGWLYTLEKGLHAYGSLTKSYADAKEVLKTYTDTKGQPFVDRMLSLLKKKPEVPLETKMAALAQLSDHVAQNKGP